ncbi:MAG: sodium:solute symporter [Hyphomicrobiaceae bacterium]|nr:sodium:solute symporter [Hyphomicrobiaceae bacterium]
MRSATHNRLVNPRLGTYFSIFASAFCGLVLVMLILEQLGAQTLLVGLAVAAGPALLYAAIGLLTPSTTALDYFACGRRVPSLCNGLVTATVVIGGTGVVCVTGAIFIIGFDALFILMGWTAGLVVMAILIAPFYRKFGAFTPSSYLGMRFESRLLRILSAALLSLPLLLMLIAEIKIAALAGGWVLGLPPAIIYAGLAVAVILAVVTGGMRAHTWSSTAKAIACLLALVIPVAILAVMITNLPLPQLSHGPVLKTLGRLEKGHGLLIGFVPALAFDLPGAGLEPLLKRLSAPFGAVGQGSFILAALVVMAGVAAMPCVLSRIGTSPGVYETRKSFGWGVLFLAVVTLTLSAIAVFFRETVLSDVAGLPVDRLPAWFLRMNELGLAAYDTQATKVTLEALRFKRDAILLGLPLSAGFPSVLVMLMLAGALAAALAAIAARCLAMANMLSEDILFGGIGEPPSELVRLMVSRGALMIVTALAVWIAAIVPGDPLLLLLWGLAVAGASLFPVLVLSIWWKRINVWGALAGLLTGVTLTVACLLFGSVPILGLDPILAGTIAIPAALAAAVVSSLLTPAPGRAVLERVRDMRVPGGEAVHDREVRLERLQRRKASLTPPGA